jgi:type I restriction enzyme S subunit
MRYPKYESYKDSGVEWLNHLPKDWTVRKLKFVALALPSNVDKKSHEGEIPVYLCNYTDVYYNEEITQDLSFMKATASQEQIRKFTLKSGDTIITKDSEDPNDIAIPTYVPDDMEGVVCGYHLALLRSENGLVGAYLKRLLDSHYARSVFATRANGLTRYGLSTYAIKNFVLPLPSIEEQKQIATFLDKETTKIDTLIEKQQRLIKLLKEKRQAVISHAVTKGLNPDVKMKDSGVEWLGEVPEHWFFSRLKYLSKQIVDGAHFTPTYVDEGVPFLRVTDIHSKEIDLEQAKSIPVHEHIELIRRCKPEKGDILLSKNGTIGIPKVIDWDWEFSIFVSLCLIKLNGKLIPEYTVYFFLSAQLKEQIFGLIKQSTVINLHLDKIANFWFCVPPLHEQNEIVKQLNHRLSKLDNLINKAEQAVELLQERRTALISAAVTGKIDVRKGL